jgi:hypothetical protein
VRLLLLLLLLSPLVLEQMTVTWAVAFLVSVTAPRALPGYCSMAELALKLFIASSFYGLSAIAFKVGQWITLV